MKIQYCSDLHLEFPENKQFLKKNPIPAVGEVLILAGDIVLFSKMHEHSDFFDYVSDNFKYTYWIPGNHEYYYFDIADKTGSFREAIRDNVFLVNNIREEIDHVNFLFSTLWTEIKPDKSFEIAQNMNDFYLIYFQKKVLTTDIYNHLHNESLMFLQKELKRNVEKCIVATHHCPTFLNYPEHYKNSILNSAFAVELFDLIEESPVDYWIYGHTHHNTPEFMIGKTKLLTNQLGYVFQGEHKNFVNDKTIII
ncbi:MAG: metallophosphoesterase [Bacteroidales bacterium]|nr:metallophosphoesterase [Bacteroidales bacterium]